MRSLECAEPSCGRRLLLCASCYRGHRYCSRRCSTAARTRSNRVSRRRHQRSCEGRRDHADRQRRYRARRRRGLGLEETNAGALDILHLDPGGDGDRRSRRLGHKLDRARVKLILGDEAGAQEDVAAVAEEFADRPAVTFDALMRSIRGQD